jgi:predicted glycogen debranching enzyme
VTSTRPSFHRRSVTSAQMARLVDLRAEWLEADGLGGFASGTVSGIRTRRYHGMLLASATPPTNRWMLVNGFEAWVETPSGRFPLSSQRYVPDVVHPDGANRIVGFTREPWPTWTFGLPNGVEITHELVVSHGSPAVALGWRVSSAPSGVPRRVRLQVRPLLSGRDVHATHHENAALRFEPRHRGDQLVWEPYRDVPRIISLSNGEYRHEPAWFRQFQYDTERERGLDFVEDLASPGWFDFDLTSAEATWVLAAETPGDALPLDSAKHTLHTIRARERARRSAFPAGLARSADEYIVRRGRGKSIVAGYPWFSDWGRDTFIAMRGLCIAAGRLSDARDILLEWAGHVSDGMLPNYFPEQGEPSYNSVDASLWFILAVHDLLHAAARMPKRVPRA